MQRKPGQEIASVLPFNSLFLSHCTSEITNGNSQGWGASHHRRKDMIFLALGDVVSSHPTMRPWHGPTQWSLVWLLHSKLETASTVWASDRGQQRVNMTTMLNNSPGCVCKLETRMLCDHSKQTGPQGLCSCMVNKLILLIREGWSSLDKLTIPPI